MGEPINQYCPKCDDGSKFVKQKWHACQDGDMYYVQDNPEGETYVASFSNYLDAEKYCDMLEDKELDYTCETCGLEK